MDIFNSYISLRLISRYRKMMVDFFWHPSAINSLSLQPQTNGKVISTACHDGILRIFDLRINNISNISLFTSSSSNQNQIYTCNTIVT